MEYDITIVPNNQEYLLQVESPNKKGQQLYNQRPNRSMLTGHFEIKAGDYNEDSIPGEIRQKLRQDKEEELVAI